ncbi:SDR family oxidoreductase [Stenotrophomonas aracearum]|jgi:NAD(P)-dependent dehydrogenase (short-subunit alcohol dehydrogenase family)|uniref:SDR family oxidoreductase n=1 Tax=Stenotrophomonas aracearum TaxID=3003272 RepID=A0ABY9YD50_9GAMM|nr:SDR family oxidoreductase [Stenotrophomonas sp. A5588]WNH48804.1 SDR family oxidoreductase [Stenotrophomonas sp. A5588]
MQTLHGKTALITGGSSGIGLATAKLFAAQGAHVIITGRRKDVVDAAVASIGSAATGLLGDVADIAHHDAVAAELKQRFGGLDIYMANAGLNTINDSAQVSPDEFDAQFSANARGVFFGVQNIAPIMRDGGAIIITSSIASQKVLDGHAVYAGSKAAIEAFARSWMVEFRARRIRVNVLSPGPVNTPILDKLGIPPEQRGDFEQQVASAIPLGRLGEPEELASAALFLASDAGSFVNGVVLRVDGGMSVL